MVRPDALQLLAEARNALEESRRRASRVVLAEATRLTFGEFSSVNTQRNFWDDVAAQMVADEDDGPDGDDAQAQAATPATAATACPPSAQPTQPKLQDPSPWPKSSQHHDHLPSSQPCPPDQPPMQDSRRRPALGRRASFINEVADADSKAGSVDNMLQRLRSFQGNERIAGDLPAPVAPVSGFGSTGLSNGATSLRGTRPTRAPVQRTKSFSSLGARTLDANPALSQLIGLQKWMLPEEGDAGDELEGEGSVADLASMSRLRSISFSQQRSFRISLGADPRPSEEGQASQAQPPRSYSTSTRPLVPTLKRTPSLRQLTPNPGPQGVTPATTTSPFASPGNSAPLPLLATVDAGLPRAPSLVIAWDEAQETAATAAAAAKGTGATSPRGAAARRAPSRRPSNLSMQLGGSLPPAASASCTLHHPCLKGGRLSDPLDEAWGQSAQATAAAAAGESPWPMSVTAVTAVTAGGLPTGGAPALQAAQVLPFALPRSTHAGHRAEGVHAPPRRLPSLTGHASFMGCKDLGQGFCT